MHSEFHEVTHPVAFKATLSAVSPTVTFGVSCDNAKVWRTPGITSAALLFYGSLERELSFPDARDRMMRNSIFPESMECLVCRSKKAK